MKALIAIVITLFIIFVLLSSLGAVLQSGDLFSVTQAGYQAASQLAHP